MSGDQRARTLLRANRRAIIVASVIALAVIACSESKSPRSSESLSASQASSATTGAAFGTSNRTLRYELVVDGASQGQAEVSQRGPDVAIVGRGGGMQAIVAATVVDCGLSPACRHYPFTSDSTEELRRGLAAYLTPFAPVVGLDPGLSSIAPSGSEVIAGVASDCRQQTTTASPSGSVSVCVSREFGFLTRFDNGRSVETLVSFSPQTDETLFAQVNAALSTRSSG